MDEITSLIITYTGNNIWTLTDQDGNVRSEAYYSGSLVNDLIFIKSKTGGNVIGRIPFEAVSYVDQIEPDNSFTPIDAVDLLTKLKQRGFFDVTGGGGGGVDRLTELLDVATANYLGKAGWVFTVNDDQTTVEFKPITGLDQDNIDIRKIFYTGINGATQQQVVDALNLLPAYTVTEHQSVWFISLPAFIDGEDIMQAPTYKYKMMNKGKGTYGAGQTQLSYDDLELIYIKEGVTVGDIEADPNTDIINYLDIEGQTISEWLNSQSGIPIQSQADGYTLFKGTIDGDQKDYLWVGTAGTYGTTGETSTMDDFQLLEDGVPAVTIPTFEEVRSAGENPGWGSGQVTLTSYPVGEELPSTGTPSEAAYRPESIRIKNYNHSSSTNDLNEVFIYGGNLGLYKWNNGILIGGFNLVPHPTRPFLAALKSPSTGETLASEEYVDAIAETKADLVDGKVPASQLPSYVDDIEEYPTLGDFPATGESGKLYLAIDTELIYRWTGSMYAEISPTPLMTLQEVTDNGNTTTNNITAARFYTTEGELITSGDLIIRDSEGNPFLLFPINPFQAEISGLGLTANRQYQLPDASGTLTLQESDIKTISATTYTLLNEDAGKVLHFTSSTAVTVTIPSGLATNKRYEGAQLGDGQVSFVTDGTTLRVGASEVATTAEKYSVFGLDWIGTNEYLLYGKLELA